jgi:hypothetical protein
MDWQINPDDRLIQRQREAHAIYVRLQHELQRLTPGHPIYPALRAAVGRADAHWRAMIDADVQETTVVTPAMIDGAIHGALNPWGY